MPRRRLEPPPADRIAVILGMPSAASSGTVPSPQAGWVPQRKSVAPTPGVVPTVVPAAVVPMAAISTEVERALASGAPAGPASAFPDAGRHRRPGPPKSAVLTVPVALRGVRAKPRRLAVLGALALLAAAVVILGIRVAWASSSAKPQSIAAAAHGTPSGLVARTVPAAFAPTGAAGLPTASARGVLLVHVVGQVRRPGVVHLPPARGFSMRSMRPVVRSPRLT